MHLAIGERCGMMLRQMYDDVGLPCTKTIIGEFGVSASVSTYAIEESRTDTLFLLKGNPADISSEAIFDPDDVLNKQKFVELG